MIYPIALLAFWSVSGVWEMHWIREWSKYILIFFSCLPFFSSLMVPEVIVETVYKL